MAKPKDRVDLDEKEFDDKQAQTHASGTQQGMMRAAGHMRNIAGGYFQRGDDKMAKELRGIANDLEKRAEPVYTAPNPHTGTPWQGEGKTSCEI